MRRVLWFGLLVAMVLVGPLAAAAQTIDKDEKAVKKYAVPVEDQFTAKAKGFCVCLEDTDPNVEHLLGRLVFNRVTRPLGHLGTDVDAIQVRCEVSGYFQGSGTIGAIAVPTSCDHWVPLAK